MSSSGIENLKIFLKKGQPEPTQKPEPTEKPEDNKDEKEPKNKSSHNILKKVENFLIDYH